MLDAQEVLKFLTNDHVIKITYLLGHTDPPIENSQGYKFSTVLCHEGENYNLQYYEKDKHFYCFSECQKNYSIYDLIMYNTGCNFYQAVYFVASIIGLTEDNIENLQQLNWGTVEKDIKKQKGKKSRENPIYPEIILNQFHMTPYKGWVKEGIIPEVQKEFEVGLSIDENRVIVPHRAWDTGKLIGVVGRTLESNYKKKKIAKWLPLYDFYTSLNIFGLWQNFGAVMRKNEIILAESEKSPMLAKSYGVDNVCALSGKDLSYEQLDILKELNVEVVLALDKDVDDEHIKKVVNKIKGELSVSVIYSRHCNSLDDKDSPFDKGREVFERLYANRVRVS